MILILVQNEIISRAWEGVEKLIFKGNQILFDDKDFKGNVVTTSSESIVLNDGIDYLNSTIADLRLIALSKTPFIQKTDSELLADANKQIAAMNSELLKAKTSLSEFQDLSFATDAYVIQEIESLKNPN